MIASDLGFAHRSGAALAMIPAGKVEENPVDPDFELLEVYQEVANVISRLVNEAMRSRVRLDPAMEHPVEALQNIVVSGHVAASVSADIEGYGVGTLGVWQLQS